MLIIYGSMLCKDCVRCREDLDKAGIAYTYFDFNDELKYLKEFLAIRDKNEAFATVKEAGKIGIPCILEENGCVSLTWEQYL